jgi:FHA domain
MTGSGSGSSHDDATKVIFSKIGGDQPTVMMPGRGGDTVMVPAGAADPQSKGAFDPVVGWLVVVDGLGRGQFRPVRYGQNAVGRGQDLRISIDFGDQRISREPHAFVIYDEVQRRFFIRDNGKSNIVRLNGEAVLSLSELHDRDRISIGETTLLFVALCDQNFDWLVDNAAKTA